MKKRLLILCITLGLFACKSEKDKYVENYDSFVHKFMEQCDSYTKIDWDAVTQKNEDFHKQYSQFMQDMSIEERTHIDSLNNEVNAKILKHSIEDAATELESTIKEATGAIEQLLDDYTK